MAEEKTRSEPNNFCNHVLDIVIENPQTAHVVYEIDKIFSRTNKPEFAGERVFEYIDDTNVTPDEKETLKELAQSYIEEIFQAKVDNIGKIID